MKIEFKSGIKCIVFLIKISCKISAKETTYNKKKKKDEDLETKKCYKARSLSNFAHYLFSYVNLRLDMPKWKKNYG